MSEPIIVAFPTILDGLVLRWYADLDAYQVSDQLCSASRYRVSVYVSDLPEDILNAATRAHELLDAGREAQARAMATHRPKKFLGRELEPVAREEVVDG